MKIIIYLKSEFHTSILFQDTTATGVYVDMAGRCLYKISLGAILENDGKPWLQIENTWKLYLMINWGFLVMNNE